MIDLAAVRHAIELDAKRGGSRRPSQQNYRVAMQRVLKAVHGLTDRLVAGEIGLADWEHQMLALLEDGHIVAGVLGRQKAGDLTARTAADYLWSIPAMREDAGRVRGFVQDLKLGRYSDDYGKFRPGPIESRQSLYVARMRGTANAAYTSTSPRQSLFDWVMLNPEHCDACPALQEGSPYTALTLPSHPGDGATPCRVNCIASAESRVWTHRGQVPIADVVVGDYVLTHKGRFRKVIDAWSKPADGERREMRVVAPSGAVVVCTDDHRWLTDDGWMQSERIACNALRVYTSSTSYEALQLRGQGQVRREEWPLSSMSFSMRMRQPEGYSCRGLRDVSEAHIRDAAVGNGGWQVEETGWNAPRELPSMANVREAVRTEFQPEVGWALGGLLQRPRWAKEVHLPLSMALDCEKWANPCWVRNPSQEWRVIRRPDVEFATSAFRGTSPSSLRGVCQRAGRAGLPSMRESVQEKVIYRAEAKVLFGGVLPQGTSLYDLTVEEDHSFVVEGMVSHNCGCVLVRYSLDGSVKPDVGFARVFDPTPSVDLPDLTAAPDSGVSFAI